jgi:hypothetical protein
METDENTLDAIRRLGREINKVLEMIERNSKPNVQNISSNISRNSESQRRDKIDENSNHVTTLTGRYDSGEESSDQELTYEELVASYKELCTRSVEVIKSEKEHKRITAQLQAEKNKLLSANSELQNEVTLQSSIITGLQEENTLLNSKLENMTKSVRMLNNSSNVLDEILQVGKTSGNMKGIGFDYGTMNKEIKNPTKKFVPPKKKTEFVMLDQMPQHPVRHLNPQPRNKKKSPWICHHFGKKGHIRSFCFKLYGYPQPMSNQRSVVRLLKLGKNGNLKLQM